MAEKITSFKDLEVWKQGHTLVLMVYKITKRFPPEEKYGLSDQMRRCSVSVTSNIAEGFSRQSSKEKNQFYFTSKGSLTELHNQLIIARDINYLSNSVFEKMEAQINTTGKLLSGLIRYLFQK